MSSGGSAGGFSVGGSAGFGGFAGGGAQTPCPREPSGRIPGCAQGLLDVDGDGYGDPLRPHACCGEGWIPAAIDCDDTDPTRTLDAFADGDGDGLGIGEPVCSANPPPSGLSSSAGDCDDANPALHWQGTNECPCERFLFEPAVAANPDCANEPDLFVVDHEECALNCGQSLSFRIGNAGGVAAEGPIVVSVTVRSEQATLELGTIGPGEASGWVRAPLLGFSGPATITIQSPRGNCTALRRPFEVELAMCARP